MDTYPDPKGYFDLRCVREDYKASLLKGLDFAMVTGTESMMKLMDVLDDIDQADRKGRDDYQGVPLFIIKPWIEEAQREVADQVRMLQDVNSIVREAPACGASERVRQKARIRALSKRRKVRGKVTHKKAEYGGDEYEFTEEFDLGPIDSDQVDVGEYEEYGGE